jgi:hypothetical protein
MCAKTKHNDTCTMAFGRPSAHDNCPRCNELKQGAKPRKGWGDKSDRGVGDSLKGYCFTVNIRFPRCTKETNPQCACGKMSYTD